MSHRVKAWLSSIRRSNSFASFDGNSDSCGDDIISTFDNVPSDVIQYILSFLHHNELHFIRLIGKEWNNLCDVEQKILSLNIKTPTEHIKYWMLKLRHIRHVNLSKNNNIDNQFLIWLKKEYFPIKIRQKRLRKKSSLSSTSDSLHINNDPLTASDSDICINIHIDLSFCFGIDCVEEPQLYGRGGVNGHNDYLKKVINLFTPHGCTFNIFGNFRIINPSLTLHPKHVVLLQLEALKCDEVQHCFKFSSPANRQFTGPLPRFERMIKNGYPIMINWDFITLSQLQPQRNRKALRYEENTHLYEKKHFIVAIEKKHKKEQFKWTLSKQHLEPYCECWMTDTVCSFYSR